MLRSVALRAALAASLMATQSSAYAQAQASASDQAPQTPKGSATKVLVIPYQPIFRSADVKKTNQATEYLNAELGSKETVEIVRAGTSIPGQVPASMDEAMAALERARTAEADHRIDEAIAARREAIDLMEKNAPAIPEAKDYILAHHRLARALLWTAKDKEAQAVMKAAGRMSPNLQLPPEEFSRLYRSMFRGLRQELEKEVPAEVLVRSVLPGAEVSLDGRSMATAPVRLLRVPPGKHILSATVEGAKPTHAILTVPSGKKLEYTVAFGETVGGPSVGKVADSITENSLPKDAVAAAQSAGKAAAVDFVVVGGLAKDEDHFNVHTFVLDVPSGKLKQLEVSQFDLDLLTAESDVLRVVIGVEQSLESFDGALASANDIDKGIRRTAVVTEVEAGPDFSVRRKKVKKKVRKGPRKVIRGQSSDFDIKD